jgi:hypothetical protein
MAQARLPDRRASPKPEGGTGRRSIEERIALAMPAALVRVSLMAFVRLPPSSKLRRYGYNRAAAIAFQGINRNDYEFALLFYAPDVEIRPAPEFVRTLGLAESYHGHEGFVNLWDDTKRDMTDLRAEPEQIVDHGGRIALRETLVGVGSRSGVATRNTLGLILHVSPRGLFTRLDIYWTWEEALAEAKAGQ